MDPTPAAAPTSPTVRPNQTRTWIAIGLVLLALILIWVFVNRNHDGDGRTGRGHAVSHRASVSLGGRSSGLLQIDSGADRITVTTGDLAGDLAVVTTPDGAGVHPRTQLDGQKLRIWTEQDGDSAGASDGVPGGAVSRLDVRIARSVTWDVALDQGAKQIGLNLGSAAVRSVSLTGGADHVDLTLGRPHGTGTVRFATGLGSASIHLPDGVPVRITLASGAGTVVLDGDRHQGVAAGTTLTSGKAAVGAGADQLVFEATGGIGTLTLDRVR